MARKSGLVNSLHDLDQAARIVTGKPLADNIRDIAGLVQGQLAKGIEARADKPDLQDLADCELLGVSPSCSERVARLAWRAFAEVHHPDRPGGNEETFKLGGAAFERLRLRRGWNPH